MLKHLILIISVIFFIANTSFGIEVSTITLKNEKNVQGAIEFTNNLRDLRQKLFSNIKIAHEKSNTSSSLAGFKAYSLFDLIVLGIGNSIAIHEVGHTNVFDYQELDTIALGTGNNNNATLLEVYLFSIINGGAFASYSTSKTLTPYDEAFHSGSGTNATFTMKKQLILQSIQSNTSNFTTFSDINGIHISNLGYVFEDTDNREGNDFKLYISSFEKQGYDVSIDNLRTQLTLSSLLSRSFNLWLFPFFKNTATIPLPFKEIPFQSFSILLPEFTTYLMPNAVTLHSEIFIKHPKYKLLSIAYEHPTFGNKSNSEWTLGWYPSTTRYKGTFRLILNSKNNTYGNINNTFWITEKFAMFTKFYIGNSATFAQMREALSDSSTYAIGLKYKL